MKKSTASTLMAIVVGWLTSQATAQEFHPYHFLEPPVSTHEPNLEDRVKFEVAIPVASDGDLGLMPLVEFQKQITSWISAGASLGWVEGTSGGQTMSNLGILIKAGQVKGRKSRNMEGWSFAYLGDLRLGFGMLDLDSADKQLAMSQGFLFDLAKVRFGAESIVVEPSLVLAAANSAGFGIQGYLGPSLEIGLHTTDQEQWWGLQYGGLITFDAYFFALGLGVRGYQELDGQKKSRYSLDLGWCTYLENLNVVPWLRVTIPMHDEPRLASAVLVGATWRYGLD